ncbi:MAG: DUF5106 domain-containing protein [Bacteroidales bacterium]|nr:DUF5106 domain-containing protein [Bacteroidales bacterium]
MHRLIAILSIALLLASATVQAEEKEFVFPVIPATLTTPEARASYLVEHFWDNVDFSQIDPDADGPFVEQAWVNFLSVMDIASEASQEEAFDVVLAKTTPYPSSMALIDELAETYLFSYDSPMRNDLLYIMWADAVDDCQGAGEAMKARAEYNRAVASSCWPGSKAPDFVYVDAQGVRHRLSSLQGKPVLLMFYDPDCDDCQEAMKQLASGDVKERIASGALTMLAIDIEGEGRQIEPRIEGAIYATLADDRTIEELYPLRGYPTLYLLTQDLLIEGKEILPEDVR